MCTQELSVHKYDSKIEIQVGKILKRHVNLVRMTEGKHHLWRNIRTNDRTIKVERDKLKAKQSMQVVFWGFVVEYWRKSAKVALIILYGFLDTQKHGGEPLVQSWNGVIFLHLRHKQDNIPFNIYLICQFLRKFINQKTNYYFT